MEPVESRHLDKEAWGPGPWQDEPDRVEWRSEGTPRLAMLIVRNQGGALCGYVGVPEGHPWHGKHYRDVDAYCHGGLTYADPCQEGGKICHVPLPGEAETVWWLGFDCAHYDDVSPGNAAVMEKVLGRASAIFSSGTYKSIGYVRDQVEALAAQAQRVAKGLPPLEDD